MEDPSMENIFSQMFSDIHLVKDEDGLTYIPSLGINLIGNWEVTKGYKIKASDNIVLTTTGTIMDAGSTPISLLSGWSTISFLPTHSLPIGTALSSIVSDIILVKNGNGDTWIPSQGINNVGMMEPGQGYQIKMQASTTLIYPNGMQKTSRSNDFIEKLRPVHYRYPLSTGHNATIILPVESIGDLTTGDEIGIFNRKGTLAGSAVYEGGPLAITVWGDDPTTDAQDGLAVADEFVYRVWRSTEKTEFNATVAYEQGDEVYRNDGVSYLKRLNINEHTDQAAINIYPNPSSDVLNIEYYLPKNEYVEIKLLDVYGKEIFNQTSHEVKGKHLITLHLTEIATGLYLCDFKSGDWNWTVKVHKR